MIDDNDECIHGLGPISACTICNGKERAAARQSHQITARFPARYEGVCPVCWGHIDIGDDICRTADDRYVCSDICATK